MGEQRAAYKICDAFIERGHFPIYHKQDEMTLRLSYTPELLEVIPRGGIGRATVKRILFLL